MAAELDPARAVADLRAPGLDRHVGARFGQPARLRPGDRGARAGRGGRRHRPRRRRARRRAGRPQRRPRSHARARLDDAAAYLELHIEQGPVLERAGRAVGVVTGTAGVERHRVSIRGQAVQGGAFPMDARHAALVAAARLVLELRAAASDERSRATVGDIDVEPGIPTAVPGTCELVVDQRHPDAGVPAAMLFVQSLGGISHHRDEDTRPEHLELAVRTLHALTTAVAARVADGSL